MEEKEINQTDMLFEALENSDQIKEGDVIFDEGLQYRSEPQENERLLNMALSKLYKSYKSNMR